MTKQFHIILEASDGKIIEAEVEVSFTPKEGFDGFVFDDVTVTDPKTGLSEDFGSHAPEEYISEMEYEAEGHDLSKS